MSNKTEYSRTGVSNMVFVVVVVILLIVAGVGFGLYYRYPKTSTITNTITGSTVTKTVSQTSPNSSSVAEVSYLAYSHWASIGNKNLTQIMSQYYQNSTLYWYVDPSSALNGTYSSLSAIQGTWQKFLSSNPSIYYTVKNYSVSVSGSSAIVNAELWYVLGNGTVTLKLPYTLSYALTGGAWKLQGDWWGLSSAPGTIVKGVASYSATTITTSATNSITTSTVVTGITTTSNITSSSSTATSSAYP
ncbi:MAG: hypothetical protein JRN20_11115 [Nitrososphaerota archaeon]|nr:hypothetical protein [Nitrososphaerota archaeon]MDG6923828.1 hypothetical protein [Nitrososphaerota archaeon]